MYIQNTYWFLLPESGKQKLSNVPSLLLSQLLTFFLCHPLLTTVGNRILHYLQIKSDEIITAILALFSVLPLEEMTIKAIMLSLSICLPASTLCPNAISSKLILTKFSEIILFLQVWRKSGCQVQQRPKVCRYGKKHTLHLLAADFPTSTLTPAGSCQCCHLFSERDGTGRKKGSTEFTVFQPLVWKQ